jgi:activator of HSP90 ATPase
METKDIHQKIVFENASPHDVYEMLMDEKQHAAFSGEPAKISREVGGTVSAYGGWIEAVNVELIPDEKIIETWRGKDWPQGHYSRIMIELAPQDRGTVLTFTQTGVPGDAAEHIDKGWHEKYWNKMKKAITP